MNGLFTPIITGNSQIDRIQANITNAFNSLSSPFIGGVYLTNIALVNSTPLVISHGLGRIPSIWTLGDINAAATIFRDTWTTNTITLEASANCIISIWVN